MRATDKATFFANAAAGTSADFTLMGGEYLLVVGATGSGGTVTLNVKSDDGTYEKVTPVETAITAAGTNRYVIPPGTYQLVIATLTAITATIIRIPHD